MKYVNYILVLLMITFSCTSSKSTATANQIEVLNSLLEKRNFSIESDWAYPQTTYAMQQVLNSGFLQPGDSANSINLIGNSNYLTISGDSITSYLPYFGERQMQVAYGGNDSAIQFNGLLEDYKTEKNKNNSHTISFKAKSNSEQFNVTIVLFPSLKSNMTLIGSSRFPIRYSGTVTKVD